MTCRLRFLRKSLSNICELNRCVALTVRRMLLTACKLIVMLRFRLLLSGPIIICLRLLRNVRPLLLPLVNRRDGRPSLVVPSIPRARSPLRYRSTSTVSARLSSDLW